MSILTRREIMTRMENKPPLVEDFLELRLQLQNNGFDLTLRSVASFSSLGQLALDNEERILPETASLEFGSDDFVLLPPGQYRIVYNEIVHLPNDILAFGFPRSSLLRCGADIRTAVWDAGYSGRSESLLLVHNSHGLRLKHDARIMQLVFMRLDEISEGYKGRYLGENT